ncbi:MAG: peptidoglycan DD-metalloendopeptidase family protein [Saprospiraceae bacterium]
MKKVLIIVISLVINIVFFQGLLANTWLVGPSRTYTSPSKVSNLVNHGDTIIIDAGIYAKDVCFWKANHLYIKGINGKAHLKAEGTAAGQKAIWVIQGDSMIIENIEFSECKVADKNGAGIRLEGTHLVVRNCYFHNNEDGILAGDNLNSKVLIEYSEFAGNGYGDGLSHNLYINHINSLTFRYNYSHDAVVGHLIKSRAHNNYFSYNRLSEENGSGSYEIDLPNGGFTVLIGNIIQQGSNSQNSAIISYGKEGLNNPTSHELYLSHNTIINNKSNGTFIQLQNGTSLLFELNNIFAGPGKILDGIPTKTEEYGNISNSLISYFMFKNPNNFDYSLLSSSPCFNKAYYSNNLFPLLTPFYQYNHSSNYELRNTEFINDVGALESHFLNPFVTPIEGKYGEDFIIVNYVDWGIQKYLDAFCGSKTYESHQGTDFVLSGFEQMQQGVNIRAADAGIVTAIKDGLFDMETVSDTNKHFGNYICIKHPGNYYSYYAHLKKNSTQVKVGDVIQQGQLIAKVGCSGNCTDPYLHFELWWDSLQIIDPFSGPCGNSNSFWKDQIPYDSSFQVWKQGLQAGQTSLDSLRFHKIHTLQFDYNKDYYATYWNLEYGLRKGDLSSMQWFNESGNKVWQFDFIHSEDAWYYYYWSNVDVKTLGICNNCEARYLVNGKLKDKINFKVIESTGIKDELEESIFISGKRLFLNKSGINAIHLFDLNGKLIWTYNNPIKQQIDLPQLNNGLYIVKFLSKDRIPSRQYLVLE